jgi:hypothetical protein
MPPSPIEAFAACAETYCAWASGADGSLMTERGALQQVSQIYTAALLLPQPWTDGLAVDTPRVALSRSDLDAVQSRAATLQGQFYFEVFDPYETPPETPVVGHLTDDLGDIYRDIARGLVLFNNQRLDEALWEWAFNFRIHWGEHATGAIRALHAYLSQENPDGLSRDAEQSHAASRDT